MNPNDNQVGGSHYKSGYQHWDFVLDCLAGLYLEGCITKYVARWRKKNGLQDILKAKHYLEKLMEQCDAEYLGKQTFTWEVSPVDRFCLANSLGPLEGRVMYLCATWENMRDLRELEGVLHKLEHEARLLEQAPVIHPI
jgi:hypothetical protein